MSGLTSDFFKAPPHNSAARLAMSFPPSAACKFLDLHPVNLRNLHLHLTKNPFASRPPHLCGVTLMSNDCVCVPVIAHFSLLILRFFTESWGKSSLGARLRTRKVTGRDASLPAPLLAASLELVARGTVGALPQTPAGTLSLHPARGNCPLTLFGCPAWLRFPTILCRSSYAFTSPNSLSRTASASFRCSSGII